MVTVVTTLDDTTTKYDPEDLTGVAEGTVSQSPRRFHEEIHESFVRPKQWSLKSLWPRAIVGSARSVDHVRMARDFINGTDDRYAANYHTMAGVASAYASIDALLVFFNFWFRLGFEDVRTVQDFPSLSWSEPSKRISMRRDDFLKKLKAAVPSDITQAIEDLRQLERTIGPYRHRALHRDGIQVTRLRPSGPWRLAETRYVEGVKAGENYGWSPPMGQEYPTGEEPPIADMLDAWADRLESTLRSILPSLTLTGSPDSKPMPCPQCGEVGTHGGSEAGAEPHDLYVCASPDCRVTTYHGLLWLSSSTDQTAET